MGISRNTSSVEIRCKGVLFDMDGILISSLGSVERSWTKWARMRGIDPAAALGMIHGRRSIESVRKLRPDLDAEAENRIIEGMEIEDREGIRVLPGVTELLEALPAGRWTVVTSATERLARVRLEAAGLTPPLRMIAADQVTEGKPSPQPYLAGASLLGLNPEDCVVFEDAASGVQAGLAAGCTVVATRFSHADEQLAEAHIVVDDLTGA
jgi:sugar-phosphatase